MSDQVCYAAVVSLTVRPHVFHCSSVPHDFVIHCRVHAFLRLCNKTIMFVYVRLCSHLGPIFFLPCSSLSRFLVLLSSLKIRAHTEL